MDIEKVLAQLREELELINSAIANFEKMGRKAKRARGRPRGSVRKSNPAEEATQRSSKQLGDLDG